MVKALQIGIFGLVAAIVVVAIAASYEPAPPPAPHGELVLSCSIKSKTENCCPENLVAVCRNQFRPYGPMSQRFRGRNCACFAPEGVSE